MPKSRFEYLLSFKVYWECVKFVMCKGNWNFMFYDYYCFMYYYWKVLMFILFVKRLKSIMLCTQIVILNQKGYIVHMWVNIFSDSQISAWTKILTIFLVFVIENFYSKVSTYVFFTCRLLSCKGNTTKKIIQFLETYLV